VSKREPINEPRGDDEQLDIEWRLFDALRRHLRREGSDEPLGPSEIAAFFGELKSDINALRPLAKVLVLALGFIVVHDGRAGELYKCKGPHGEVTFTNMRCPDKTESQHYGSYMKQPDALPEATPGEPAPEPSMQPAAAAAQAPTPAAIAGYQCVVDDKAWIQVSPCPPTIARVVYDDVDTSGMTSSGEFVHGSGTVTRKETVSVNQHELDHNGMCTQLAARANTSSKSADGPSSSYERNRMRQTVGC
jgi:hypothetical protein